MATVVKQNFISGYTSSGIYHESLGTFGNVYAKNQIINSLGPVPGVYVVEGMPTFVSNVISGNYVGVGLGGIFTYCTLTKNTIMGNTLYGIGIGSSSGYLSKNYISGSDTGVFQAITTIIQTSSILTLIGNKVTNNTNHGVYGTDSTGTGILDAEKNFSADNGSIGIGYGGGQGVFMDKNRVASNQGGGMGGPSTETLTMTKNLAVGNTVVGVGGGVFSMIYKNRILATEGIGIFGFTGSHVEGNKVTGSTLNGIDGSFSTGSLIESNKAFGNGDGVTYFDLYDNNPDDVWFYNKYDTASLP